MFLARRRARFVPQQEPAVSPLDPASFALGWNDGFSAYWGSGDQYRDLASRSLWFINNDQIIAPNESTTSSELANNAVMGYDGYPTGMPSGGAELQLRIPLNPVPVTRAGVYNVTVDEVGPVLVGSGGAWAESLVWNAATGTGTLTVDTSNPTNGQHIKVTDFGGASKAIIRIQPSFGPEGVLSPEQASDWAPFSVMRHMTNQQINRRFQWDSGIRTAPLTAAMRNTGHHATFGTGFSVEMAVAASNELMKHLWWCVPHDAADDYIAAEAAYIAANLNPALSCIVEYSNEIWNPQFQQTTYIRKQGLLARYGQVDPTNTSLPVPSTVAEILEYDPLVEYTAGQFVFAHVKLFQAKTDLAAGTEPTNAPSDDANYFYLQDAITASHAQYGFNASHMADIYIDAFAGMRSRLIVVCADQTGQSLSGKTLRLTTGDFHTKVDMYACAYYFGDGVGSYPRLGNWTATPIDKALLGVDNEAFKDDYFAKAELAIDAALAQLDADQAAVTSILASKGYPSIPVGNYEWGNHTTWTAEWLANYAGFNTVRDEIWLDPRNGQMYALLAQGFAARGGIHVGFDMVGGLGNTSFGITQATNDQADGRWSALKDFSEQLTPTDVPENTVVPSIIGTAQVGETLTATRGIWTNLPTSFVRSWERDGVTISGETSGAYTLVEDDEGTVITHLVTASNAIGAGSVAESLGTAAVAPPPAGAFTDEFDVDGYITADANYTTSGTGAGSLQKTGGVLLIDTTKTTGSNAWMFRDTVSATGQKIVIGYDYANGGSAHSERKYALRATDPSNMLYASIDSLGSTSIKIRKRVAGVDSYIGASSSITLDGGTPGEIEIRINSSDVISFFHNGVAVGTLNVASHVSSAAGALSGTLTGIGSITRGPPTFPDYVLATRFETSSV